MFAHDLPLSSWILLLGALPIIIALFVVAVIHGGICLEARRWVRLREMARFYVGLGSWTALLLLFSRIAIGLPLHFAFWMGGPVALLLRLGIMFGFAHLGMKLVLFAYDRLWGRA